MELNFGIKGFALFLWSHRRNDIETSSVETVEIWWWQALQWENMFRRCRRTFDIVTQWNNMEHVLYSNIFK